MESIFDKKHERKGTGCKKWDYPPIATTSDDIMPMWIADMDFAAPDCVIDNMKRRLEHPIIGYFELGDNFYTPIMKWQKLRFGVDNLTRDNLAHHNSVLGGIVSALDVFTNEGDPVLVHAPTYGGFMFTLKSANRNVILSELIKDENDRYVMDFADMEKKITEHNIKCAIFCSPHNPTGRVWDKEEVVAFSKLCEKHGVKIISDEIWSDFVFEKKHIITQSVSEYAKMNTVALYSPTKTFNIAGLIIAYSVVYDLELAKELVSASEYSRYNHVNAMSVAALEGAYNGGEKWVDEMLCYIKGNLLYAVDYIKKNMPNVNAYVPEGTYLLWVDLGKAGDRDTLVQKMADKGLIPNNGKTFNDNNHIRINLACPREYVIKGMKILEETVTGK